MIPGMANNPALQKYEGGWAPDCAQTCHCVFYDTWRTRKPWSVKSKSSPSYRCWFWKYLVKVNKFIKDFNQAKQLMQGVMSGDMNKMMKQMGITQITFQKYAKYGRDGYVCLKAWWDKVECRYKSGLGASRHAGDMSRCLVADSKGKSANLPWNSLWNVWPTKWKSEEKRK